MAQTVSPGSTNTLENKSKPDLYNLLGVPRDKSQKISDPDTLVSYDGGWTNPNWHIGGVPASSKPASTTGVPTAQDDTSLQARAERQHTVGLAGAVRAGDIRANDVSDHQEEAMDEGSRGEVEEIKREENKAKSQTVEGGDPDEAQDSSSHFLFLPTAAAVTAAIASAAHHRRPRFMRKAIKGLKKAEKKARKAAATAKQAEKDVVRLKNEEAAAQHAAQAARVAERTAKANARIALATKRAEEAAKRSRTAEQAVLETAKKAEKAKEAVQEAERVKRAAVIAEKNLSGFRRFFTVASSVGKSTLIGMAAGRLVHAGAILALGKDKKIAMEKAIGVLEASPFSDAATKKLKAHDWGGFATQLASDVVDGAKDMAQGAKELYDNKDKIMVAMGKAIEDIKKIGDVYAKNPGDVQNAFKMVLADLGLKPENMRDIAYGELTGDQSAAKSAGAGFATAAMNDSGLINTVVKISDEVQNTGPTRRSPTIASAPKSETAPHVS